jgi:predicted DNA-binding transcriptional regulator YafY
MRTALERRQEILSLLNVRRYETIHNLAFEFGVSYSTIKRDILVLSSISTPIYTTAGRYGGGVYMMDGASAGRKYLSDEQTALLKKLAPTLSDDDRTTMQAILKIFAVPEKGKRRL